jgi:hypothetical protein
MWLNKEEKQRRLLVDIIHNIFRKCLFDILFQTAFYREFLGQMITGNSEVSCLPVLQYIICKRSSNLNEKSLENGNTTVYEWRYGEPPLRIEEPSVLVAEPEAPTTTDDAVI